MPLILKVKSYCRQPLQAPLSGCFNGRGGIIGRSDKNAFCLPDPQRYVSRRHAEVHFHAGGYFIADIGGGNPVRLNGTPIPRGRAEQIRDGDYLDIGDYQLGVCLLPDADLPEYPDPRCSPAAPATAGMANADMASADMTGAAVAANPDGFLTADNIAAEGVGCHFAARDPLADRDGSAAGFRGSEQDQVPEIFTSMPLVTAASAALPEDYDFLADAGYAATAAGGVDSNADHTSLVAAGSPAADQDADDDTLFQADRSGWTGRAAQQPELADTAYLAVQMRSMVAELLLLAAACRNSRTELGMAKTVLTSGEALSLAVLPDAEADLQQLLQNRELDPAAALPLLSAMFRAVASHQTALASACLEYAENLRLRYDPAALEDKLGPCSLVERCFARLRQARAWQYFSRQVASDGLDLTKFYLQALQALQGLQWGRKARSG